MDEADLRKAWEVTLRGDPDSPAHDPDATYTPDRPSASGSGGAPGWSWDQLASRVSEGGPAAAGGSVSTDAQALTLHTPPPDPAAAPTAPPPSPEPREQPPSYELREVIGRGGMGIVFRAVQTSLQREVAVKKLHPTESASAHEGRFVAEAMVGGLLDHPNVLPVHDLGRTGRGELLIAMKLARGPSWKRLLHPDAAEDKARAARMDRRAHLEVLLAVCNAVAYAHQKGVAHLDIKPENVLVGELGEVLVMDWGLAVALDEALVRPGLPYRGAVRAPCGTPAYMPPELAEGDGAHIGPWTDTYLLGAALHEVVTGAPPHRGKSVTESIMKAIRGEVPTFGADVPPELAAICRKALQPRPEDRYQRATDLRDAVAEHLRHADSVRIADQAREALGRARAARASGDDASRAARYGEFAEAVAGFRQAHGLWAGNDDARRGEAEARRAYAAAALEAGDLGLASAQAAALRAQATGAGEAAQAADLEGLVRQAELERARAARGARLTRLGLVGALAAIGAGLVVGLLVVDGERRRAERGEAAALVAEQRAVESARGESAARADAERRLADSLLNEGRALAGAGQWHRVRERLAEALDLLARTGRPLLPVELGLARAWQDAPEALLTLPAPRAPGERVVSTAFAEEADVVVTGDAGGAVRAFDRRTGRVRFERPAAHPGGVAQVDVSLDGRRAVSGGADGKVRVWDLAAGEEGPVLDHGAAVFAVAISPFAPRAASGGADGTLRVWDLAAGALLAEVPHDHPIAAVDMSFDGDYVATGAGRRVRVMHVEGEGNNLETHEHHTGPVTCVALLHDQFVLSGGADHRVVMTKVRREEMVRILGGHVAPVRAVGWGEVDEDAMTGYSLAADGTLRRWDLKAGKEAGRRAVEAAASGALAPDLGRFALVEAGGALRVHDLGPSLPGGREAIPLVDAAVPVGREGQESLVERLAVDPAGEVVVGGSTSGVARVWDVGSGRPLVDLPGHRGRIVGLDVARPAGGGAPLALTVSEDGSFVVWDLPRGLPARTVRLPAAPRCGAFAADGARVVTGGSDGVVRVHDARGQEAAAFASGHDGPVSALALAGDALLTGGDDGAVRLGSIAPATSSFGGNLVGSPRSPPPRSATPLPGGGTAPVLCVALSETHAAAGAVDGTVTVWDLRSRTARWSARRHAGPVVAVSFAGGLLLSAGGDARCALSDPERDAELGGLSSDGVLRAFAASPDGRVLVTGGQGAAAVWDLRRVARREGLRAALPPPGGDDGAALAARGAWSGFTGADQDAAHLLHAARDAGAEIDEAALATAQWRRGRFADAAAALSRLPAGDPLRAMRLDALQRGVRLEGSHLGRQGWYSRAAQFTPDGRRLVTTCKSGAITVWDARSGTALRRMYADVGDPGAFGLSPDGRFAVIGGYDESLEVWDLEGAVRARRLGPAHPRGGVSSLLVLEDGTLLTGGRDRAVRLWPAALAPGALEPSAPPVTPRLVTDGHGHDVRCLALSPDGKRLATVDNLHVVHVWDLETGERVATLEGPEHAIAELLFLPDGSLVAAVARSVWLWAPGLRGPPRLQVEGHEEHIYALAASPDGARLVTSSSDGTLRFWNAATLGELRTVTLPQIALHLGWSPDGTTVAAALGDGEVRLLPAE